MPFDELVAAADRAALEALGAEPVVYQPSAGAPVEVMGIFDENYVLAVDDADAGVMTLGPAVFLILVDLPTDPEEDDPTLTIRGDTYRVVEPRPAGQGAIVLTLRLVT